MFMYNIIYFLMITSFDTVESIKHTFLMNLRTGNIIIDGILTTIVISLITNFYNYHSKIYYFFQNIIKFIWKSNIQKVSFNCTEITSNYSRGGRLKMHGSDAFKAIMLNIRENIKNNNVKGLNCLREFCGDQDEYYWNSDYNSKSIDESIKDIIYLIDQDEKFTINNQETSNLYFQMKSSSEDQTEGEEKKK